MVFRKDYRCSLLPWPRKLAVERIHTICTRTVSRRHRVRINRVPILTSQRETSYVIHEGVHRMCADGSPEAMDRAPMEHEVAELLGTRSISREAFDSISSNENSDCQNSYL